MWAMTTRSTPTSIRPGLVGESETTVRVEVADSAGSEDDFDIGLVALPEQPQAPATTAVPTTTTAPVIEGPATTPADRRPAAVPAPRANDTNHDGHLGRPSPPTAASLPTEARNVDDSPSRSDTATRGAATYRQRRAGDTEKRRGGLRGPPRRRLCPNTWQRSIVTSWN